MESAEPGVEASHYSTVSRSQISVHPPRSADPARCAGWVGIATKKHKRRYTCSHFRVFCIFCGY